MGCGILPVHGLGRVRRPCKRSKTGRGTLPKVWDRSEDPTGGQEQVGCSARRFRTSRGSLQEVRVGGPPGGLGQGTLPEVWVGGPSRRSGLGREALQNFGTGRGTLPNVRGWSGDTQ